MPGTTLLELSLRMEPDTLFVQPGTAVQLSGSATVRHWLGDCTRHDSRAPIEWSLFYQSIDSPVSIPVTSFLVDSPESPVNQFTVGDPGTYDIVLTCPLVAATTSQRLIVGGGAVLDGTATAWVNNQFLGCKKYETDPNGNPISFHAVIITALQGTQSTVSFDPISTPKATITQTRPGTGTFDPSTGTIDLQLHGFVQAVQNGTVDITLSTNAKSTTCDNSSISGSALSGSRATLVGDAPVNGPTGTTHCWLAVNANVTTVNF